MVHITKENGIHILKRGTDVDIKFGATVVFMKDIGKLIRPMAVADSYTPMATFMPDTGKMTRPTVSASTRTRTAPSMKATGLTINNMVKVKSTGLMVRNMKDSTNMEKKTVTASFFGPIARVTVAIS